MKSFTVREMSLAVKQVRVGLKTVQSSGVVMWVVWFSVELRWFR